MRIEQQPSRLRRGVQVVQNVSRPFWPFRLGDDVSRALALVALLACGPRATPGITLPEQPATLPSVVTLAVPAPPTLYGLAPNMTLEQVRARLGFEDNHRSRGETAQWWKSTGYEPARELPFLLGFDEVLTFNQDHPDPEKPISYVYFDEGRAVLFIVAVSEQSTNPALTSRFGFPPRCFINGDESDIEGSLGRADVVRDEGGTHRRGYYYLHRGITAIAEGGRIGVLNLFAPLGESRAAEVAKGLRVE